MEFHTYMETYLKISTNCLHTKDVPPNHRHFVIPILSITKTMPKMGLSIHKKALNFPSTTIAHQPVEPKEWGSIL